MPITADQLRQLGIDQKWLAPFNETFVRFGISTPKQQAAFIGQCGHECGGFRVLEEGLTYSAERLTKVWPKRFPTLAAAQPYARNPKALANLVYANRMGNRDEASGDGYRFRGRGCIQTTGSANYHHAGKALDVDLIMNPDLVSTPEYAALTAGFFWSTHGLNALAEAGDHKTITKRINGGLVGYDDRVAHTNQALAVLA